MVKQEHQTLKKNWNTVENAAKQTQTYHTHTHTHRKDVCYTGHCPVGGAVCNVCFLSQNQSWAKDSAWKM